VGVMRMMSVMVLERIHLFQGIVCGGACQSNAVVVCF
jgi:hypothetical protein